MFGRRRAGESVELMELRRQIEIQNGELTRMRERLSRLWTQQHLQHQRIELLEIEVSVLRLEPPVGSAA